MIAPPATTICGFASLGEISKVTYPIIKMRNISIKVKGWSINILADFPAMLFGLFFTSLLLRVLTKLGSDALASHFDEAKAIVSDEFCKMSLV